MTNMKMLSERPYPHNLICQLDDSFLEETEELPEDFLGTVEYVISTLTPREQTIIRLRYGAVSYGPMTLAEIGKKVGVNSERIRQIEARALRKLKHPSRWNVICQGVANHFEQRLQSLITTKVDAAIKERILQLTNEEIIILRNPNLITPIEYLNLSVRSFNCLYRAGIKTYYDLSQLSKEDLKTVRNLGKKGRDEIITRCKEEGIVLKGSELD